MQTCFKAGKCCNTSVFDTNKRKELPIPRLILSVITKHHFLINNNNVLYVPICYSLMLNSPLAVL